jgi:hypothetical protein
MTLTYRRMVALLALAVLFPLLATTSAGAVTPSAGETVPLGEAFTVAEGGADTAYGFPDISSDPITGRTLMVYDYAQDADLVSPYDDEQIKGRVVGNNGVIGDEFQINTTLPSLGIELWEPPTAAWNSTFEEWLVTWTDDMIVYGQRVDADGSLIDDNFVIAASLDGPTSDADNFFDDIEHVRAEWSPTYGVYVVTWKAAGSEAAVAFEQTILATVIDEAGDWVLDGQAVDVSEEPADNGVTLAYSPTSDVWLVGWARVDLGRLPGARVLSVSPSGPLFAIDFESAVLPISTGGTSGGGAPETSWDSTRDRFIVIWRAMQVGDAVHEHYYNFVDPDGTFDEADEQMLTGSGDEARRARVAYSPVDDEYAVIAHNQNQTSSANEIRTWTIAGDGSSSSAADLVTSVGDERARPVVAFGGGCFRYVWWDIGQFWDDSQFAGLPDTVNAYFDCSGCYDFDPGSDTFSDVTVARFYDLPIGWLLAEGLTTGTTPTTYEPDRGVTRGEFATFLWRFAGEPAAPLGSATFTDVTPGRFYDRPIGWLLQDAITTGTTPTTFDPDRTLTRGELATFLWRFADEPAAPLGSATFTDVTPGRFYDRPLGWL